MDYLSFLKVIKPHSFLGEFFTYCIPSYPGTLPLKFFSAPLSLLFVTKALARSFLLLSRSLGVISSADSHE